VCLSDQLLSQQVLASHIISSNSHIVLNTLQSAFIHFFTCDSQKPRDSVTSGIKLPALELSLLFPGCGTWSKSFSHTVPQFPHFKNVDNHWAP
jgi:hypothetical protein